LARTQEGLAEDPMLILGELPALKGHVEDVDGFVSLGVDEHHLDVASGG